VLVMEDVTAIKIGDFAAIEAAGVNRVEVAQRLLDTYLQQVFEDRFFHADPHPGNLFVYPLPPDAAGDIPEGEGAPFYLIFVDFGMTGHLTEQIVEGIRETLVSIFTQDVRRMVKSFERLGILLPGADMDRIEEAMRTIFDRIWGLDMSKLVGVAYSDMYQIARDFADLLYTLPFQVPQDFVFLSRALNILAGICTALDPDFNPWASVAPYAQRFILEEQNLGLNKALVQEAREFAALAMRLPRRADAVLHRADRGDLRVQMKPTSDFQRQIDRLETTLNQVVLAIVFASVVLASTLLYVGDQQSCGSAGFVAAAALLVLLLWRGRPRLG
jgi:predicted unusual protein kinase regulating ubiquinone biosynthesis (AarF/ABC1/UbiB family)